MSSLVEINTYLDQTRNLSVEEINALIRKMDQTAEPQVSQGFAHSILGYMKMTEIIGEIATFADSKAKAENLKSRHSWLFSEPTEEVAALPVEAVTEVSAPKAEKAKVEKKSDVAKRIYDGLADKSKANVLAVFQRELNTSPAGCVSYYYAIGGEKSGKRGRKASGDASPVIAREAIQAAPTKRQRATALFAAAADKTRPAVVAMFMRELDMTQNGATTYAYAVGVTHLRKSKT